MPPRTVLGLSSKERSTVWTGTLSSLSQIETVTLGLWGFMITGAGARPSSLVLLLPLWLGVKSADAMTTGAGLNGFWSCCGEMESGSSLRLIA